MTEHRPIIFVIDDDLHALENTASVLEEPGIYNIHLFNNPVEFINDKLLEKVDLFIINISLKRSNGRELYKKVCSLNVNSPALFISSVVDDETFGTLDCDGLYDFMSKPFPSPKIFLNRVRLLLKVSSKLRQKTCEQTKAEKEKERINNLFEAVLEQAPFGIDVIEKNGSWRIVKSSNKSKEITGDPNLDKPHSLDHDICNFIVQDLNGKTIGPTELPGVVSFLKGISIDDKELVLLRADGSEVCVAFKSVPVKNSKGEIIAGLQISHDITEQKNMELLRLEQQAMLRAAFEAKLKRWRDDISSTQESTKSSLKELSRQTKKLEESRSV